MVGGWRLVAAGGWRQLAVGGWWRLAVGGGWWLVVDGPLGRSLRAVLNKTKKQNLGPKGPPCARCSLDKAVHFTRGHEQRILSSHIPPCHGHMVIATILGSSVPPPLLQGCGGGEDMGHAQEAYLGGWGINIPLVQRWGINGGVIAPPAPRGRVIPHGPVPRTRGSGLVPLAQERGVPSVGSAEVLRGVRGHRFLKTTTCGAHRWLSPTTGQRLSPCQTAPDTHPLRPHHTHTHTTRTRRALTAHPTRTLCPRGTHPTRTRHPRRTPCAPNTDLMHMEYPMRP